jgi:hypothetical protein
MAALYWVQLEVGKVHWMRRHYFDSLFVRHVIRLTVEVMTPSMVSLLRQGNKQGEG